MDPRQMDNLEKDTFKPYTPTMKKFVNQEVRSQPIEGDNVAKS